MTSRRTVVESLLAVAAAGAAGRAGAFAAADPGTTGPAITGSYFGMHFHRLVRKPGEAAPTVWPAATAIGSVRLWDSDTRWADVQPQPGRWDFGRLDAYVAEASDHQAEVLYTLGSTPKWASARPEEPGPYGPGCAAEPQRLDDWRDYVRRVVSRYRGAVQAYELWNEPNFSDLARDRGEQGFFSGSVASMVEMARIARQALDELDPRARLLTPGFVNGPHRLALFLRSAGARLVDGVAYHFYSDHDARFLDQVAEVRAVMRQCGVAGLPLWNTECGVEAGQAPPAHAGSDDRLAGARLAQFLLLGGAHGMERFYYYAWDDGHTGMLGGSGAARARAEAYARTQEWITGTTLSLPERRPGGGLRVHGRRGDERFTFLWSDTPARWDQPAPRAWRAAAVDSLFDGPQPLAATAQGLSLDASAQPMRVRWERADPIPR